MEPRSKVESMSKLTKIDELSKDLIPDNSVVAIGGVHSHNVPMSLVRQVIRFGVKNLTLVGSISAGLPIDILVGAGTVQRVLAPYVGMEMWGLAPMYRRAVQSGSIDAPEVCEAFPIYSLRAAANGIPFHPFPERVHEFDDIPSQSDLYKKITDPFTAKEVYAVQALSPDIAFIHVQKATASGDCVHLGSVVSDRLMAEASKYTIVTCDELVDEVDRDMVTIPSFMVDKIIPLEGAAFPTSSHGLYRYSETEIQNYLKACRTQEEFDTYINSLGVSEKEYLQDRELPRNFEGKPNSGKYTMSELVACIFSRDIRDGELGICGAVADIPMAAMRLAERMHAPNMRWISGGSGYVSPRGRLVPSSTDFEMSVNADTRLSMDEVIAIEMTKIDFFFAGGLQIDEKGSTNLGGIPKDGGWKLRGPGSVGLPFLPRAGRSYLYTLNHTNRTLVKQVNYISGPGHFYEDGGPTLLVTNLCVFEWNDGWRLKSLHPNVTLEQVEEATAFDFKKPKEIPQTKIPSEEELRILREIDVFGVLK